MFARRATVGRPVVDESTRHRAGLQYCPRRSAVSRRAEADWTLSLQTDLQHLIQLQDLDLAAERARRRIADMPALQAALDARLADRSAAVTAVKERIAVSQTARREIEKELAVVQTRLSKYKGQLMEVKTNKEYQAMQHEIAAAEQGVRGQEDLLLDRMEEAETLAAELKAAEAALKTEQNDVARDTQALAAEQASLERETQQLSHARSALTKQLSADAVALFEHVARHRKGQALSEARDGHCTQCHVRLRPQVFNDVRRNDSLIQCESCSRILYFIPAATAGASPQIS
jgi:predicted  nucleic acid-binding Zn-ribbon protein